MEMVNKMTSNVNVSDKCYVVVHPLDDQPEVKRSVEGLGLMPLSRSVKYSLLSLRLYLILMGGLVLYRALQETGVV